MAEYVTLRVDSIEHDVTIDGKPVDRVFVVMGDSSYYFDRERIEAMGADPEPKPEPPATERVPHLVITYMDGSETALPTPQGIMFNPQHRTVRVVGGPTVPLDSVRFWRQEMR